MTDIKDDERVQLANDLPELGLHRGDSGVVCSRWFDPETAFEVEFRPHTHGSAIRALLMPNQIYKDGQASKN